MTWYFILPTLQLCIGMLLKMVERQMLISFPLKKMTLAYMQLDSYCHWRQMSDLLNKNISKTE